ncbi:MAG: SCO family protein [Candidatus Hydrogenedens sp.]|nr:SCO family protein [Candidatus Hydrogenedens sp.]
MQVFGGQMMRSGGVRGVALALLSLCVVPAMLAHAQAGRQQPGTALEPVSFRAPDPALRFKDIYIEQKLEQYIPLDLTFTDENGQKVSLGSFFTDKPVVLALVYYECPSFCNIILQNTAISFDAAANKLQLGEDYIALAVSIDPRETPQNAVKRKQEVMKVYSRGGADNFHFLTGEEDNIERLANAVGFRYYYDASTDQYAHAGGIMILTPKGQLSSYYLGTEYLPKKVQFALMDAAEGRIGPLVDSFVALCFAYDPSKGAYGFYIINAIRLFGGLTVAVVGGFIAIALLRERALRRRGAAADDSVSDGGKHASV